MMVSGTKENARDLGRILALAGLTLVTTWFLGACAPADSAAGGDVAAPDGGILARIGDIEISRSEVEEAVASQLLDLDHQRHKVIEQGLAAAINDRLVEIAAQEAGLPVDAYLVAEIDAKIRAVTETDIDQLYEQRKTEIGQPKAAVAEQMRKYLEQTRKQALFGKLVSKLRDEHQPQSLLEPLRIEVATAGAPSRGPESAPVTIVEFSDFQCPFCSKVIPTLERLKKEYPDAVRLVFRQFPLLSLHPQALKAAEASLCANDQGKFWEMHDAMFANQDALGVSDLKATAQRLALDSSVFDDCMDSARHAERVNEDLEAGVAAGVSGTPAMFINGRFLSGAQPYNELAKIIDDELRRVGG